MREDFKAFIEGKFWRAVFGDLASFFPFSRSQDLAFDERAVFGFQLGQFRKSVRNRKPGRVSRINARDQRIDGAIKKFLAEPANDELRDAFFFSVGSPRDERFT